MIRTGTTMSISNLIDIIDSGEDSGVELAERKEEFRILLSKLIESLSGFEKNNKLNGKGKINFWLDSKSFGIVECYHHTILHIILDELHENK